MRRQRLLITISFSFSIRYIVRTGLLQQLRSFCEPVIAITWDEEDLISELRAEGFEVHVVPEHTRQPAYNDARRKIDIWFNRFCLRSPSQKIQQDYLDQYIRFERKLLRRAREWYNIFKLYFPSYKKQLFEKEKKLLHTATNFNEISAFVDSLHIDAVFTVTPFHKQEDLLLRACKYKGKKMLTSILSFDNITKRGWIPVEYDVYMVWNKYNREQLHRIYPYTKNKPVHITGAPQFDFYFKDEYLFANEEWKKIVGINAHEKRKIVLYAGGPNILFPNEPQYLKHLAAAISEGKVKNSPVILFRCHPVDNIERWKEAIGVSSNVVFDTSWTGGQVMYNANITNRDIRKLCSTLAYTDVHVNLCSTMTVDGSAFGKPQIGPAYDEVNSRAEFFLQQMYNQEHFLPVIETDGLMLATSKEQFIGYVNKSLEEPSLFSKNGQRILRQIITYPDGESTCRVTAAIENFLLQNVKQLDEYA